MEKYESFEELKNSDTESSKDGKVKHEELFKKFFELLRENVVNKEMKNIKKIKNKR